MDDPTDIEPFHARPDLLFFGEIEHVAVVELEGTTQVHIEGRGVVGPRPEEVRHLVRLCDGWRQTFFETQVIPKGSDILRRTFSPILFLSLPEELLHEPAFFLLAVFREKDVDLPGPIDEDVKIVRAERVSVHVGRHAKDLANLERQEAFFLFRVGQDVLVRIEYAGLLEPQVPGLEENPRTWTPLRGVPSKGVKHWATYLLRKWK